jgi:pimeloyl-ACP methyl ester carboxylesterase
MELELNFHPAITSKTKAVPILFVHGMAHAAWCWEWRLVPYFNALGYDCYSLSLRGHGNSPGKGNMRWFRISEYLEDVEAAISRIKIKPIVIAHSMGGFILQKYLLKHEDLPAVVTLSSVPHNGMMKGSLKTAMHFPWPFLKGNLTLSTAPFSEKESTVRKMIFSEDIDSNTLSQTKQALEPESFIAYLDMLFLNLHEPRLVKTPLLFLHGKQDFIVDEPGCAATAKGFGATFESMENVAHDMMIDTRWKIVANRIEQWLITVNQ